MTEILKVIGCAAFWVVVLFFVGLLVEIVRLWKPLALAVVVGPLWGVVVWYFLGGVK